MHANKFVESYFDAWNHHDPQGIADHLAANGTYWDIPENVQRSHDELVSSLNEFFSSYCHRYELIGDVLTNGDTIAFQYEMVPAESSRTPATPDTFRGAEFITLHEHEALTIIDYCDDSGAVQAPSFAHMPSHRMRQRKYAKSGLSNDQLLEYRRRLEQIMQVQQIFLQPDMTLPKLAEAINCSVNHLSQVINSGFGISFFDYLNRYRIDHAKQLLAQLDGQNCAILNVAFTVGFNSNSAFYAAFKKCVGQTPAQYRKTQLSKPH